MIGDDGDGNVLPNNKINKHNIYFENLISIGVNLIKSLHTLCHSIRVKQEKKKFHNTKCLQHKTYVGNGCTCLIFTRELITVIAAVVVVVISIAVCAHSFSHFYFYIPAFYIAVAVVIQHTAVKSFSLHIRQIDKCLSWRHMYNIITCTSQTHCPLVNIYMLWRN